MGFIFENDIPQDQPLIVEITRQPEHGFAFLSGNEKLDHMMGPGDDDKTYSGLDRLRYRLYNGSIHSNEATVSIETERYFGGFGDLVYNTMKGAMLPSVSRYFPSGIRFVYTIDQSGVHHGTRIKSLDEVNKSYNYGYLSDPGFTGIDQFTDQCYKDTSLAGFCYGQKILY